MKINFKKKLSVLNENMPVWLKTDSLFEVGFGIYNSRGVFYGRPKQYYPYKQQVRFSIKNLMVGRMHNVINDLSNEIRTTKISKFILGDLEPKLLNSEDEIGRPQYSKFCSSQKIEKFDLHISVSELEDQEICQVSPGEDSILIILEISENRFNEYVRLIENNLIDRANILIKGVPGIYKPRTSIFTSHPIKILGKEQIDGEEDKNRIDRYWSRDVEEFEVILISDKFESTKLGKGLISIQDLLGHLKLPIWILVLGLLVLLWRLERLIALSK
jgi:hypothetical protein